MIQMNDRRKEGLEINKSLAPNEARTYELRLLSLYHPLLSAYYIFFFSFCLKTPSCTQLMPKVPEPSNLFQGQNLA